MGEYANSQHEMVERGSERQRILDENIQEITNKSLIDIDHDEVADIMEQFTIKKDGIAAFNEVWEKVDPSQIEVNA